MKCASVRSGQVGNASASSSDSVCGSQTRTALRSDVLGALGVLKVATADQLQRLLRPGAASNKAIRQALGDLALHGLVASDGNTRDRQKTWRLEGTAGLEAAGHVLGLPRADMGSTARGAGRSGAQHAMAVNETISAFVSMLLILIRRDDHLDPSSCRLRAAAGLADSARVFAEGWFSPW
ncbi:replication-relaxation family protein [Kitasatospora sp. NPDC059088]|uniref:replication-relaxation family protein n=1 Tax=Kitasatospora sp. NPDC059088 TaxID=3346722 RepID=UPI0036C08BDF